MFKTLVLIIMALFLVHCAIVQPSGRITTSGSRVETSTNSITVLDDIAHKNTLDHAWAGIDFKSGNIKALPLRFEVSDTIAIYCNGKHLFRSSNFFRQKSPMHRGNIAPGTRTLILHLLKCVNRLRIRLSEKVQGWGFVGHSVKK